MFWPYYLIGLAIILIDLIASLLIFYYWNETIGIIFVSTSISFYGFYIIIVIIVYLYYFAKVIHGHSGGTSRADMISGQANMMITSFYVMLLFVGLIGLTVEAIILGFYFLYFS
jgi:hypothetical protein